MLKKKEITFRLMEWLFIDNASNRRIFALCSMIIFLLLGQVDQIGRILLNHRNDFTETWASFCIEVQAVIDLFLLEYGEMKLVLQLSFLQGFRSFLSSASLRHST